MKPKEFARGLLGLTPCRRTPPRAQNHAINDRGMEQGDVRGKEEAPRTLAVYKDRNGEKQRPTSNISGPHKR